MRAPWIAVALAIAISFATATSARAELIKVGLFGDSIAEGDHVPDALHNAMPGQLRDALRRAGAKLGGRGLVAAMPRRMTWTGNWQYLGFLFDPLAPFGASGYSAVTDDPTATATLEVSSRRVAVFYVRSSSGGVFSVSAGRRTWTIDGKGPSSGAAHQWIDLPAGVREVVVHGPSSGRLRFTGILDRSVPKPGETRVELSNLAHGARWAEQDFGPYQRQAVSALGLDLTVLMYGGNEGLGIDRSGDQSIAERFQRGLVTRGRFAVRNGGACLVIPPGRAGITTRTRHLLARAAKAAAKAAGCTYAPVLANLRPIDQWNTVSEYSDGIHPTARGYRVYANAVAPEVLRVLDDYTARLRAARRGRRSTT